MRGWGESKHNPLCTCKKLSKLSSINLKMLKYEEETVSLVHFPKNDQYHNFLKAY